MFGDVHVTKSVLRWRTALVLRELEEEIQALEAFHPREVQLAELMAKKAEIEEELASARLSLQRAKLAYGPRPAEDIPTLEAMTEHSLAAIATLDARIAPLAQESSTLSHPTWGLLMRTGNDKSLLARQMERYADVYTSRVANFVYATPFLFARSSRGSLPHDPGA
jgi:hypothetical protein